MMLRRSFLALVFGTGSAVAVGGGILGQDVRDLEPVDQAVEDLNPLSRSFRVVEDGLAAPQGFRTLYRMPGLGNRYLRGEGALFAVFPQSAYFPTEEGDVPLIPAGTVFYIGLPGEQTVGDVWNGGRSEWRSADELPLVFVGRWHERRVIIPPTEPGPSAPPRYGTLLPSLAPPFVGDDSGAPAIVTDAAYRSTRMRELLRRAATAEADANANSVADDDAEVIQESDNVPRPAPERGPPTGD